MTLDQVTQFAPAFALIFIRIGGMMLFAPLFGSSSIPRRVRILLAMILTLGLMGSVPIPEHIPDDTWSLSIAVGGELIFGVAMGMILSFVFVAVQWAGEIIGQQMGLNLSEVFDPQFGGSSSLVGQIYFMFALVIFLIFRGHHIMLLAVRDSFTSLPLLSVGMDHQLVELIARLFMACTVLAVQLAAPILVTMLVVDVALGFISKTVPQFNIMSAGLTIRALIGALLLILTLVMTSRVMRGAMLDAMNTVRVGWTTAR